MPCRISSTVCKELIKYVLNPLTSQSYKSTTMNMAIEIPFKVMKYSQMLNAWNYEKQHESTAPTKP